jgi:hypothetical protein
MDGDIDIRGVGLPCLVYCCGDRSSDGLAIECQVISMQYHVVPGEAQEICICRREGNAVYFWIQC